MTLYMLKDLPERNALLAGYAFNFSQASQFDDYKRVFNWKRTGLDWICKAWICKHGLVKHGFNKT